MCFDTKENHHANCMCQCGTDFKEWTLRPWKKLMRSASPFYDLFLRFSWESVFLVLVWAVLGGVTVGQWVSTVVSWHRVCSLPLSSWLWGTWRPWPRQICRRQILSYKIQPRVPLSRHFSLWKSFFFFFPCNEPIHLYVSLFSIFQTLFSLTDQINSLNMSQKSRK